MNRSFNKFWATPFLLSTVVLAMSSCANLGLKQNLDPQVSEIVDIRSTLESDWNSVTQRLVAIETDVQNFGLGNFDTTLVDSEVLVEEAKGSTDVVIGEEGVETEVPDVQGKVQEANAKMEAAVAARKAASARIFSELKSGIPSSLAELTKTAASSSIKIAKIQAIADQLGPVAQDNPLMTKADMVNFRQDEQTLQSEIQSLSNLSAQIASDSVDYSARIANALATMERMDKTVE